MVGAPPQDLESSPAASRIGALARASGLRMFHFEHRVRLPLPEAWTSKGRPDLGEAPRWEAGSLPESKYQGFRHDLLLGSLHAGHDPKWTAHELCHGVVGFAWRPDAAPLFHALAARVAEALPVALWYFHDQEEPDHEGGRAFLDRELARVERSLRLGRPIPHRLATLDLSSDGLAYAAAHGPRLDSEAFERWITGFFREGQGWNRELDGLVDRALEVQAHLLGQAEADPLAGSAERRVRQDLGWRLLHARTLITEAREGRSSLDALIEELELGAEVSEVAAGYRALSEAEDLPDADDVLAVGYDLGRGEGRSVAQIGQGLETACPGALDLLGADEVQVVARFVAEDPFERAPLGRRFARWMARERPGAAADRASLEAALVHAAPCDPAGATLGVAQGEGGLVPSAEIEVLELHHDVLGAGRDRLDQPLYLVVRRAADGEVDLVEVEAEVAAALAAGCAPAGDEARERLAALGILRPERWRLLRDPPARQA